jgi:glucans biosynthesis protein C
MRPIAFNNPTDVGQDASGNAVERFHSLDALRAFALLLGVVLHSGLSFVVAPGVWAVGTSEPSKVLGWFTYYTHSFRLELFFLLAGFFARLVMEKKGIAHLIRDRAKRIILVFLAALYPMKILVSAAWIAGGLKTGWLKLEPEIAVLPLWQLVLGGLALESFSTINLTHLWFLYYLACVTALFLTARWLLVRAIGQGTKIRDFLDQGMRWIISSWLGPVSLALITVSLLVRMRETGVDTPGAGFAWRIPVLLLYGIFFVIGWLLHRQKDLLKVLERRWRLLLSLGLLVSFPAALAVGMRLAGDSSAIPYADVLRWGTSLGTSFTMTLSVLGWIGLFVRYFNSPSPWIRYLADSSYWVYVVHLPLVTALQVWLATRGLPWWINVPIVNLVAFPILLLSYDWIVRSTWIGAVLNGRRLERRIDFWRAVRKSK